MLRSPLVRFLLRLLGVLAAALALWWMLLLDPLLGGLRIATEGAMRLLPGNGAVAHASIAPNGDWVLQMPVPGWVGRLDTTQKIFGRVSGNTPPVQVRSLKVPVPGRYPILFTVSLPFFWALWIAAPGRGSILRGLLPATLLLAVIGVLSMIFYGIYMAATTLRLASGGLSAFLLTCSSFAVIDLIPHLMPPLLAVWLHDGLQRLLFTGLGAPAEALKPRPKAAHTGRGRYR